MRAAILSLVLIHSLAFARPQDEVIRDFQKTVALKPGQRVEIDHRLGNVNVQAVAGNQASIKATIRASASNRADSQALADRVEIIVDDRGATLIVRSKYPESNNRRFGRGTSFSASFDITLPEASPLTVRNRFGNVEIDGMKARVEIYNGHGAINFRNARGDHYVENHFGAVSVRGNQGGVNVASNNGNVTVEDVSGIAEIKNRFGEINVIKAGGEVRIGGGHGTVRVRDVAGRVTVTNVFSAVHVVNARSEVAIENQNGNVDVEDSAGALRASTTFGKVRLRNPAGSVDATSRNGGIEIAGLRGCHPVVAHSTFGGVRVTVPEGGNYDLSAQTTFGTIHSDLPLTVSGQLNSRAVRGKIGNGGCRLDLSTRNGNVEIRR